MTGQRVKKEPMIRALDTKLLPPCPPFLLGFLSLHRLFLRSLALNRPVNTPHAFVIRPIFIFLLLLLHASKEFGVLSKLPNGALPLLLVLIP